MYLHRYKTVVFVHKLCLILTNWSLSYKITWFHHVACKCKLRLQGRKYTDLHKWLYSVQQYLYLCGTCQHVTPVEWKQNVEEFYDICNMPYGWVSVLTCLCCDLTLAIQAESRPLSSSSKLYRDAFCVNPSWEWEIYVMEWHSVQPQVCNGLSSWNSPSSLSLLHRKCHVFEPDVFTSRVWIKLDALALESELHGTHWSARVPSADCSEVWLSLVQTNTVW